MKPVSVINSGNLDKSQLEVLQRFEEFQMAMINKDSDKLNEIISDNYTLTHMSGKTQTKEEFIDEILKGILNYYASKIYEPEITVSDNYARLIADVELDAKVYGIKGSWTLKTDVQMKKINSKWLLNDWKT